MSVCFLPKWLCVDCFFNMVNPPVGFPVLNESVIPAVSPPWADRTALAWVAGSGSWQSQEEAHLQWGLSTGLCTSGGTRPGVCAHVAATRGSGVSPLGSSCAQVWQVSRREPLGASVSPAPGGQCLAWPGFAGAPEGNTCCPSRAPWCGSPAQRESILTGPVAPSCGQEWCRPASSCPNAGSQHHFCGSHCVTCSLYTRDQVPFPLRIEGSDKALLCLSWFQETLNLFFVFSYSFNFLKCNSTYTLVSQT